MKNIFPGKLADLCNAAANRGVKVILEPNIIFDGSVEFHAHMEGKQDASTDICLRWDRSGRSIYTQLDRRASIGSGLYGKKPVTSLQAKEGGTEDWTQVQCECGVWLNGKMSDNFVRCHECGKAYILTVGGQEVFPVKVVDPDGMPKPTTLC